MGRSEAGKEQREQQEGKVWRWEKLHRFASEQYKNLREREGLGSEKWAGTKQCKDY